MSSDEDQLDVFRRQDWVSTLLPEDAAALLVRAADKARTLPIGSLARAKCLAEATSKVRFVYPWLFRTEEAPQAGGGSEGSGLRQSAPSRCSE